MTARIAFNALSVSNLSGQHVLLGHIEQVLAAAPSLLEPLLLYRRGDNALFHALDARMECVALDASSAHWLRRRAAETLALPRILRTLGVRVLFQPDGLLAPVHGVRQWVLAQNPWCFFPELHRGPGDHVKAFLQLRAYARAQHDADLMFYNSCYMARAYEALSGARGKSARILHQGVAEDAFARGHASLAFGDRRKEVVVVSAFAPHKNIEAVIRVLARLRDSGVDAELSLVGGWPDSSYRATIEADVMERGLQSRVRFVGHVSRDTLLEHFAGARAFCLLSRCESFGIPAIEAQACGTPTVVARGTAAPEIAGPGGFVVGEDDDDGAVRALAALLDDASTWQEAHDAAIRNAARFRWSACSRPLLEALASPLLTSE